MRGEKRSETDRGRGGLLGGNQGVSECVCVCVVAREGYSPARLLRAGGKSGINVD